MVDIGLSAAWALPALPLVAFVVLALGARRLPRPMALLAVAAVGLAFLLFLGVLRSYLAQAPSGGAVTFEVPWVQWGAGSIGLGMTIDPLALVMLAIVTAVSFMVHVYSLGYMAGDPRFVWFFAVLSLFTAAMLGLVLANNFLILYITWELVGLCSYLLIGFWYERPAATEAAKKAFIVTRLGDVGLLLGILLLWQRTGTFEMAAIFQMVEHGALTGPFLTLVAFLILAGAVGKSAQFPLHVWLPDAMEGPTPVSALIHAATMVAAGVYLVARSYPLFAAAPTALAAVAIIGLISALIAGAMGLAEQDLKRVLAYSTISQLGFMMIGLGSFAYTGAVFHLFTHAFFKALLFLAAGSVLHALGTGSLREMGGLLRRMPVTGATFIVGALALAGVPPLAGFWSKDEVLQGVLEHQPFLFLALTWVAVGLTALYTGRALVLAFFGEPRSSAAAHAHESPPVMLVPMLLLAAASALAGFLALPGAGTASGLLAPFDRFGSFVYFAEPPPFHFDPGMAVLTVVVGLGGLALMGMMFGAGATAPANVLRWLGPLPQWAARKFYLDDFYQSIVDRIVLATAAAIALFDRVVVNDVGVNGTASLAPTLGERLRRHITGRVYSYAFGMALGVAVVFLGLALLTVARV